MSSVCSVMPLCASVYMCFVVTCWKGLTSLLSFVVSNCECHFPIGILGQVWYLIVSIPDLCTLTYFLNVYYSQMGHYELVTT